MVLLPLLHRRPEKSSWQLPNQGGNGVLLVTKPRVGEALRQLQKKGTIIFLLSANNKLQISHFFPSPLRLISKGSFTGESWCF